MSLPVIVRPIARIEFDEAANWYEARSAGRGALFTRAVREVLDRISANPHFYAQAYEDVREALVRTIHIASTIASKQTASSCWRCIIPRAIQRVGRIGSGW